MNDKFDLHWRSNICGSRNPREVYTLLKCGTKSEKYGQSLTTQNFYAYQVAGTTSSLNNYIPTSLCIIMYLCTVTYKGFLFHMKPPPFLYYAVGSRGIKSIYLGFIFRVPYPLGKNDETLRMTVPLKWIDRQKIEQTDSEVFVMLRIRWPSLSPCVCHQAI